MHIVQAKLSQAGAGDNEAKLMMKHAPKWVRTCDPVIRSPALLVLVTSSGLQHLSGVLERCVDMVKVKVKVTLA